MNIENIKQLNLKIHQIKLSKRKNYNYEIKKF